MLKPTVKRGLMLDFIPDIINYSTEVAPERVCKRNEYSVKDGDIVYLSTRELRLEDNWAVVFGLNLAKKYARRFKIVVIKKMIECSDAQKSLFEKGLSFFQKNSDLNDINFEILNDIPDKIGALIIDFNPLNKILDLDLDLNYPIFEVDSHNIIPARHISGKQEFSAATMRRKIYANIGNFLTEYPLKFKQIECDAKIQLSEFIENNLDFYSELKNNPINDVTSGLSPYLHFGFVSSQRVALEVLKSDSYRENKEVFLEELIVRKELADNFCLYSEEYTTLKNVPDWAKNSLSSHKNDLHTYIYSQSEFENAKTHDVLWNKIQQNLLDYGRIHGYLRMYWGKKILEWSNNAEEALSTAIYLNDRYALDGNNPNGYVGILWCIAGLHDRPFADRLVTGKVRYMSFNGCKSKFDVNSYLV